MLTICGPHPRIGAASVVTREVLPARNWLNSSVYLVLPLKGFVGGTRRTTGPTQAQTPMTTISLVKYGRPPEASDIPSEFERAETASRSADDLGKEFGVSGSTIERVRTILDQATPEQIQALRAKSESGEGPGVHTMYEQVQSDKLKKRLSSQQTVLDRNFEGTSS